MDILEKARKILEQPVCDHCLGRQFGQLLSGFTNEERNKVLRTSVAMTIDKEKLEEQDQRLDLANFADYKFHQLELKERPKPKRCAICSGIFDKVPVLVKLAIKIAKTYEFKTFLIGSKLSFDLMDKEEKLWERVGIDWVEPLKAELNRESGKMLEKSLKQNKIKADFNPKDPDITFLLDYQKNKVTVTVNPLFIYGEYQKLVRGIPQTKWPSGKYKTSVEQIIAKPFMAATKGKEHKFHGLGREDIDARCLAWRPFVLEITEPIKREIGLKKLSDKIDKKKVRVANMRFSNGAEVPKIKEAKWDKTYRALVRCEIPIKKDDLKKLNQLVTEINQKTPRRVLHRRADKFRKRKVISLSAKIKSKHLFELIVRGQAGLYIKELISGDEGRTAPSVSAVLGSECVCKELDVIGIHKK